MNRPLASPLYVHPTVGLADTEHMARPTKRTIYSTQIASDDLPPLILPVPRLENQGMKLYPEMVSPLGTGHKDY